MKALARITRAVGEAIFPATCPVCRSFFSPSKGVIKKGGFYGNIKLSAFICPVCAERFIPITSPLCKCCGAVFGSPEGEDHLCETCLLSPRHFRTARAFGVYDQTLMTLIHQFKYRGKIRLAHPLGMMLLGTYLKVFRKKKIDLIVPVPLHIRRLRQRGFNQAYLLVRDWKRRHAPMPPIEKDVLFRKNWTAPQTGLGRRERIRNIKKAFEAEKTATVEGKNILLVDDVYTTGATVDECALALRKAGAEQVDVLTLARAQ
jgi:ComF family protein